MTGTIFDAVSKQEESPQQGKQGFIDLASKAPKAKETSFLNDIADYSKTALKGLIEGTTALGHAFGPTIKQPPEKTREEQTEFLEKEIPTEENFGQRAIRRGLKLAPSALASPGTTLATLPRAIAAGFTGEAAKEFGAPEWAQSAAELTAFLTPDVTKKLLSSGKNKEIIEAAKKFGLTDEQITPLIQSDFKQKWLSKLSFKRGKTQEALSSTKKSLDSMYSSIESSPLATKTISGESKTNLINDINQRLKSLPAEIRDKISPDLKDLLSEDISGKSLMNIWKDINHHISNHKELGILKEPIKKAINSISPQLGKDFELVNNLYSRYFPIAGKLKPSLASDVMSAIETLSLASGIGLGAIYGNFGTLYTVIGELGAKKIAQQMLINPRFQQLAQKTTTAINQNQMGIVKNLYDQYKKEVSKIDPVLGKKLPEISIEEFKELHHQTQKPQESQ